jgi:hypothetical protein
MLEKCKSRYYILFENFQNVGEIWRHLDKNKQNDLNSTVYILLKETSLNQLFSVPHNFTNAKFAMFQMFNNYYIGKKISGNEVSYFHGTIKNEKFEGEGSLIYFNYYETKEIATYTGSFKDNCLDGFGTYKDETGTYAGYWIKNKRDYGSFHNTYNLIKPEFIGTWVNNQPYTGELYQKSYGLDLYTGSIVLGKREGFGELLYDTRFALTNGNNKSSFYSGCWLNDKQHGCGYSKFKNGDQYTGEWFEGVLKFKSNEK